MGSLFPQLSSIVPLPKRNSPLNWSLLPYPVNLFWFCSRQYVSLWRFGKSALPRCIPLVPRPRLPFALSLAVALCIKSGFSHVHARQSTAFSQKKDYKGF